MFCTSTRLHFKWKPITIIINLLLSFASFGQIIQSDRVELEIKDGSYEVVSAGVEGLFILHNSIDIDSGDQLWTVAKLDTAFNKEWERVYSVVSSQVLSSKYYDNGTLYFIFSRNEPKNKNLELISFDAKDGGARSVIIKNFIPIDLFDFKVARNSVLIGGYFNTRPIVIMYDILEGIPILLPGLFGNKMELIELGVNSNQTFNVTLSARDESKITTIYVNTYDAFGGIIKTIKLNTEGNKDLLFGMPIRFNSENTIVAGVYGRSASEYSKGLFVSSIDVDGSQDINYYSYGELRNFFNYMKERREQRVRNRIERRKIKEQELRFKYRLMVHDVIENGDQIVLMGEAFYPKYRIVGANYRGKGRLVQSFNNGFITSDRVFEGYQYTHAVIIGFDKNGKLLWDNSFEITDILSFDLKQFVQVSINKDEIALIYVYDNNIRSKLISGNEVVSDKALTPIIPLYVGDRVVDESTIVSGLESWYDREFYVYGTQKIKNLSTSGVELNREVFFINKVIYK